MPRRLSLPLIASFYGMFIRSARTASATTLHFTVLFAKPLCREWFSRGRRLVCRRHLVLSPLIINYRLFIPILGFDAALPYTMDSQALYPLGVYALAGSCRESRASYGTRCALLLLLVRHICLGQCLFFRHAYRAIWGGEPAVLREGV